MAMSKLLLTALARAYGLSESSMAEDPELRQALEEVREILLDSGWLVVRVRPDGLALEGEVVSDLQEEMGLFHAALDEAGIQELRFQGPLEAESLEDFFHRLRTGAPPGEDLPSQRFRGMGPELGLSFRPTERALPGLAGGIQGLFQAQHVEDSLAGEGELNRDGASRSLDAGFVDPVEDRDASESSPGDLAEATPSGDPAPAPPFGDPAQAPPSGDLAEASSPAAGNEEETDPGGSEADDLTVRFRTKLPPDLSAELETFGASLDSLKRESAERIRKQAAELRKTRDHRILVELVCVLAEGGAGDGVDAEALDLARELTTPIEAGMLVARLGATRQEAERNRLARVIARTGREGAAALADALGESRDRSERRAFLDAMVTLGPLALDMARGMVEDPRWFVVRNGVAILGELGGDEAVAYITGTLANEDPRVRKESVAALAKIGGNDALALILGMLDDPTAEVRAASCRSLGLLGSERALKPLMECLEDRDVDVQMEALQALGRIGDPGAVQAVRKMALGGFFSRPPHDVRLAAFRALAAIGTPEAIRIVEKGAQDGDEAVSALARSLSSKR